MEYTIGRATKDDAAFIAETVMNAIGEEHCAELNGGPENLPAVKALFTRLAAREDSQYSYRNTFVARGSDGAPAGAIVAYDGAQLRCLRKVFIEAANEMLGWNLTDEEMTARGDETVPGEVYIDSLYVRPDHRGQGLAGRLIAFAIEHGRVADKPFGLLVEPDNLKAKALYERLGFAQVGTNTFFSIPMLHLQRP